MVQELLKTAIWCCGTIQESPVNSLGLSCSYAGRKIARLSSHPTLASWRKPTRSRQNKEAFLNREWRTKEKMVDATLLAATPPPASLLMLFHLLKEEGMEWKDLVTAIAKLPLKRRQLSLSNVGAYHYQAEMEIFKLKHASNNPPIQRLAGGGAGKGNGRGDGELVSSECAGPLNGCMLFLPKNRLE